MNSELLYIDSPCSVPLSSFAPPRLWRHFSSIAGISHQGRKGGALQAAEKPFDAVILSEAKNLGSCKIRQLQGSFVACGTSG
jgi:hypothetical protein